MSHTCPTLAIFPTPAPLLAEPLQQQRRAGVPRRRRLYSLGRPVTQAGPGSHLSNQDALLLPGDHHRVTQQRGGGAPAPIYLYTGRGQRRATTPAHRSRVAAREQRAVRLESPRHRCSGSRVAAPVTSDCRRALTANNGRLSAPVAGRRHRQGASSASLHAASSERAADDDGQWRGIRGRGTGYRAEHAADGSQKPDTRWRRP